MNQGNHVSDSRSSVDFRQFESWRPKRLVEECFIISIGAIQRRFGKQELLRAIRDCEPIEIPISYNPPFRVSLTYGTHPLVKRPGKWSTLGDGTARIYFSCPGCGHPASKLYYFMLPGSTYVSDLLCRRCHHLSYLSVNCAGNRFYQRVVKPYRQLQRIKEHLQSRSLPRSQRGVLEANKASLEAHVGEAMSKFGRRRQDPQTVSREAAGVQVRIKRTYKSLKWA